MTTYPAQIGAQTLDLRRWLSGAMAVAVLAVTAWFFVSVLVVPRLTAQGTPAGFVGGNPLPVRAMQVYREPPSSNRLVRVPCAGAARGVSHCWVSALSASSSGAGGGRR